MSDTIAPATRDAGAILRAVDNVEPLAERAYVALEELVATCQLEPGQPVSEHELVERIGLGRTPVREAVQRLAGEGLIQILPRRGLRITPADPNEQMLVLEVRRELERLLSRASAARATDAQRARFARIADGMEAAARTSDDIAFMRLDRELNVLLTEAVHNPYATRSMRVLQGHSRRFWFRHNKVAADLPLCARLHAEQARAIASGDATAAGAASDRLLDYTVAFTEKASDRPRE